MELINQTRTLFKTSKGDFRVNEVKDFDEAIEKVGIREAFDDIQKIHLGHFENIKNTLLEYFK